MIQRVCVTVDVEDFYDGMAVLGQRLERPSRRPRGLGVLSSMLDTYGARSQSKPVVTLFVVGDYAIRVKSQLEELIGLGHELASHGADHRRLPESGVEDWLRRGRSVLEDLFQRPVTGFRSPRFDLPGHGDIARYRDQLAEAGYSYVSDAHLLGPTSPVRELPVMTWMGFPLGGGSYQRMVPLPLLRAVVERYERPAVLYYHSYDFDGTLPPLSVIRSLPVARQLVGRKRVESALASVVRRFGSEACTSIADNMQVGTIGSD